MNRIDRHQKFRKYPIYILIFVLIFSVFSPVLSRGQAESSTSFEETLEQISEDEKAIVEDLFILSQEIEGMKAEEEKAGREIELLSKEISELDKSINARQKQFDEQLSILEQVLVAYQRRGPATFIETLLNSKNLSDFIKNINVIRELAHNTDKLLSDLQEEKNLLTAEKNKLNENMNMLAEKRKELKAAIESKTRLKEEQEAYLNSLKEKREYFEQHLHSMEKMWEDIKILFSKVVEEYTMIISNGYFPLEDFNIRFGLTSIKGAIYDHRINAVLEVYSKLPKLKFDFSPGEVLVEIPEKKLSLKGTFEIANESSLNFVPSEGTFHGMELKDSSLKELFRDGYLAIDFSGLVGSVKIKSIEIKDGYIEFETSSFF